ncbi:MAG: long-chain-fatty-acid--CoA ligase [Alphaproteobacteria bacterium]|nr:long-chain-fatty-acid--CoA ligase [Alphaproteobacteria bacterium]
MERIWLEEYPPGVPAEIDPGTYTSLVELLEECFKRFAGRTAFICMGRFFSYHDIDRDSIALAAWLQGCGLQRGSRIALMMPNLPQYAIAIAAVLRAGYVVVNVNPLYTASELQHQLRDCGAEAILVLENFAATVAAVIDTTPLKHVIVTRIGDLLGLKGPLINLAVRYLKKMVPDYSLPKAVPFTRALAKGRAMTFTRPELTLEDLALLQYTGGTTGTSKGAMLLHRNIVANVLQNDVWLLPALAAHPADEQLFGVCALPLYHIFGLTVCYLMTLRAGGCSLLIPNPRDIPATIRELRKYKVNSFPAVNTLYNALMHHPDFKKIDFSNLKASIGGGMAVQRAVAEQWKQMTGSAITEGYGLSETSPVLTCNKITDTRFNGTIGLPLPSTEISIRDDHNQELGTGRAGEICARGPQVMAGYWNRPEETSWAMTADGFFRTGDVGVMDDRGFTRIVDRKKDMILVSGFNVYPNEVEDVLAGHPGIRECAVIGVPDDSTGEAVKAFVVLKDPNLTEKDIRQICRAQLTGYKVPKLIEFRDELPKTPVGKILRRELRDS